MRLFIWVGRPWYVHVGKLKRKIQGCTWMKIIMTVYSHEQQSYWRTNHLSWWGNHNRNATVVHLVNRILIDLWETLISSSPRTCFTAVDILRSKTVNSVLLVSVIYYLRVQDSMKDFWYSSVRNNFNSHTDGTERAQNSLGFGFIAAFDTEYMVDHRWFLVEG